MTLLRASPTPGMQITKSIHLVEPLGAGGMGAVWVADHVGLKTRVVVKFILGGLASSSSANTRFSREAAAAAQVKSPHVVQMLDHGVTDDGVPFIVMEYLEGKSMGQVMEERGVLSPRDTVSIIGQVAKALTRVHAAGLLHRDIKPDNIFLCEGDDEIFVKLLDFGIVKSSATSALVDGETKTGQVVGTPYYMSPEQVMASKDIDERSDLWALGVVAFEALTGRRPFDEPSLGALAVRIAMGTTPKPSSVNEALPPAIDAWFAKACAREPADRFTSAKELAVAFREAFEGFVTSLPPLPISESELGASGPRVMKDSGPRPDGDSSAPTLDAKAKLTTGSQIGLASTISQQPGPLAASGAPVISGSRGSLDETPTPPAPSTKTKPLWLVGVAAVIAVVVGVALSGRRSTSPSSPPADPLAPASVVLAASATPSAFAVPSTSASVTLPSPPSPPSAPASVASVAASATLPTAAAPSHAVTHVAHVGVPAKSAAAVSSVPKAVPPPSATNGTVDIK